MSYEIPSCVFCGHPTLLFNCKKQMRICQTCQRKLDVGLRLDYDLFSSTINKR